VRRGPDILGGALRGTRFTSARAERTVWSDHAQGAYVYSFDTDGETVEIPYVVSNFGHLGFDSWSELTTYDPIRYKNIISTTTGDERGDFNGDGHPDVTGRNATDHDLYLYLYRGNGAGVVSTPGRRTSGTTGVGWTTSRVRGTSMVMVTMTSLLGTRPRAS